VKFTRSRLTLLAVAASCVALGVGISAITSAGASTSSHSSVAHAHSKLLSARGGKLLRRTVQGQLVVKTKTGFATVSFERGSVTAVSGQQLTINEGTKKATYKSDTLTIPSAAKVRVNRQLSSMSAVKPGMRVIVLTLPKRTVVIAHTPKTA
jgi:hypothetical protein